MDKPKPKQQTIAEEAGLPDNWVPVDAPPIVPGVPQGLPDSAAKNFTASLPPAYQHDSSFVGTAYKSSSVPQHSLMPLGIQGSAITNAAIQSTSGKVVQAAPVSSGGGGISSLTFTAPSELSVVGSPTSGSTPEIDLTWAAESSGTYFQGPPAGAVGFDAAASNTGSGSSGALSITGPIPAGTPEWALYVANCVSGSGFTTLPDASWTVQTAISGGSTTPIYAKNLTAGIAATVTQSWSVGFSEAAGHILYFGGSVPAIIQSKNGGTTAGAASLVFTSALTAGSQVLVVVSSTYHVAPAFTPVVTDTQHLIITRLANIDTPVFTSFSGTGAGCAVFLLSGATAAAETINIQVDGAGGTNGASIVCWEIAATTPVFARPRFGPPAPINLNDATGILPVLDGGTGSNLLTTGGTSQVLKQSTVGGNITVGQLAASNLVGYVALDAGSFSANVPSTTIVNVSSPGMYRVSFEAIVSTAATTSSTLPDLKLTWTDAGNNQPQSVIFNSAGLTTNTLQTVFSGTQVMSCSNFTNINFQTGATTPYASNAATQMQYNLRFRVEAI